MSVGCEPIWFIRTLYAKVVYVSPSRFGDASLVFVDVPGFGCMGVECDQSLEPKPGDIVVVRIGYGLFCKLRAWIVRIASTGDEVPKGDEMNIRNYRRGDAPEVRKGYLEGLILQDGSFITEEKSFFIKDESTGEASVSERYLFVADEDPREEEIA